MIEEKYIELIHKDIDRTISSEEKESLEQYLSINSEAKNLHKDLLRTEELLDHLPENDPSSNLKKRILNSIDYNKYTSKKRKAFVPAYLSSLFSGSRIKIASSFAVGLVAVGIIISAIFYSSYFNGLSDNENILGTIGLAESETIESVIVNNPNISGKIEISKISNSYDFNIDLKSSEIYSLQIEYDPDNITYDDSSLENLKNIRIEKGTDNINLISNDAQSYSLSFYSKIVTPENFAIKIFKDGNKLFEQEVHL